jgi:hypothetical protein
MQPCNNLLQENATPGLTALRLILRPEKLPLYGPYSKTLCLPLLPRH